MKIKFKKEIESCSDNYIPRPASTLLPDWYKNTPSYVDLSVVPRKPTIKKCIPIFDALTAGYIITTFVDIIVELQYVDGKKVPYFYWSSGNPVEFHQIDQAPQYPSKDLRDTLPKFMNPWAIITPPGYSCLFVNPMHNSSLNFKILEGIVDTDKSNFAVNFPFVFTNLDFEGLIPAGTPIAQVIPFKRDKWKHEIDFEFVGIENKDKFKKIRSVFFNGYKDFFWTRKEFN